ncbi:hypothetical protein [Bradyrhizobium sp. BWC-3-1]|uniref:hypothetical protein n=1 Tax=Bradyrhizobium sp. BWC-3-1 TaxID=3080012 RepID=UPI00293EB5C8|nr:hypothetical protein [Bradyrhizobium sp. BWC-3-1]WOH59462.1 hypothetical protein RX329_04875 [Bradyrhizobium sp. BWC-3-1]
MPKPKDGAPGPIGKDGPPGRNGINGLAGMDAWSPLFALAEFGGRYVLELYGWTGGAGMAPELTGYIGEFGIVADAADAVNLSGATGASGKDGVDGKDGSIILTGPRDPRSSDGKDNDFWLNAKTADFFAKEDGMWRFVINLRGPRGPSGKTGGTIIGTGEEGSSIIVNAGPPPEGGVVGKEILVGSGVPS